MSRAEYIERIAALLYRCHDKLLLHFILHLLEKVEHMMPECAD